jgi:hypothetical protein
VRWKRVSNYALLSECEQYSVAEVFQEDVARYEAWRLARWNKKQAEASA